MPEIRSQAVSVEIILASMQEEDLKGLAVILPRRTCNLLQVPTCRQAASMASVSEMPIVLCDLRLECRPWQETLGELLTARAETSVIFLANQSDRILAHEVTQQGGSDLLLRPLEWPQLFESLLFAYSRHKPSWPIGTLGQQAPARTGAPVRKKVNNHERLANSPVLRPPNSGGHSDLRSGHRSRRTGP